jgi:hypothetical protein
VRRRSPNEYTTFYNSGRNAILYLADEKAHFDWLFSDIAGKEIERIRDTVKRSYHYDILSRLIEHRNDVYKQEGINTNNIAFEWLLPAIFPQLPQKMKNDALQFCEALYVEAYYFVTNDYAFIKIANSTNQ